MTITTKQILNVLHILAWIIFIGVCIEAGAFIFSAIFTMVLEPGNAAKMWHEINLTGLYNFDRGYFLVLNFHIIIVAIMRAILFYLIVKVLHEKKLKLSDPFNNEAQKFIKAVSYLSLFIGVFSLWGLKTAAWLETQGAQIPDSETLRLGGGDVWIFMGIILLVIAQIFKKGIEIQTENDLTV